MSAPIKRDLVLALDPGATTGSVLARINPDARSFAFIAAAEITWADRFTQLRSMFDMYHTRLHAIVIERFILTKNPDTIKHQIGSEFPAVRIIGTVEALAQTYAILDRIVYQELWAKRKLTRIPLRFDEIGYSNHNADAYRHLWYYVNYTLARSAAF